LACDECILACPQKSYGYYTHIDLWGFQYVYPVKIFKTYLEDETIWDMGYYRDLRERASETFKRYLLCPDYEENSLEIKDFYLFDQKTNNIILNEEMRLFKFTDEE
jgi:hypothetical protein